MFSGHKHSGYTFWWHQPVGKDQFKNSRLWDAAKTIIRRNLPGSVRLQRIIKLNRKEESQGVGNTIVASKKYSREDDMVRRVLAVQAAVSSKIPVSVFSNDCFRIYISSLDPKHKLPHHLEVNRIIEVMIDYAMMELSRIIAERRRELSEGFISLSSDFWTDSARREPFGVLILEIVAFKYRLNDGRYLCMSKDSASRSKDILASVSAALLS